jgi:hypothetical protein
MIRGCIPPGLSLADPTGLTAVRDALPTTLRDEALDVLCRVPEPADRAEAAEPAEPAVRFVDAAGQSPGEGTGSLSFGRSRPTAQS